MGSSDETRVLLYYMYTSDILRMVRDEPEREQLVDMSSVIVENSSQCKFHHETIVHAGACKEEK